MTSFKEKGFLELRNILNTHVFTSTKTPKLQFDHANALCVTSGSDKLSKIGEPSGVGQQSFDQGWVHCVGQYFPPTHEEEKETGRIGIAAAKYVEQKVDSMKQTKEDELERYKKERESEKRFEKSRGGKKLVVKKVRKAKAPPADASQVKAPAQIPVGRVEKPSMGRDEMPPL